MTAARLFEPPAKPNEPFEYELEPRVLSVQFNDGYEQEAGDGIQSDLMTGTMVWENLEESESSYIIDFFRERNRWKPVLYVLPGETIQRRLRFTKMAVRIHDGVYKDIDLEFKEVGV